MPHGVLDKERTDRRGLLRERLRPYVFVIGSLALLIVVFALLAFAFARYYVDQRDREQKEGSQRMSEGLLLAG
ncbi:MAG: hypothetical protein ACRD5G_02345 [Candidatus Acidiferrales bacterium]